MLRKLFVLLKKHKIEIILYPFLLLYRMPVAWVKSLWESRVLLKGNYLRALVLLRVPRQHFGGLARSQLQHSFRPTHQ